MMKKITIKGLITGPISILLVLCMMMSMLSLAITSVSAAETTEKSKEPNPSQVKLDNGVTYNKVDADPHYSGFYLDALKETDQFEKWASIMYAMMEQKAGNVYPCYDDGIYSEGASAFARDFGYGQSKYGYGTKINSDVKNRNNGRLIRMVEALKGNISEASKYKHPHTYEEINNKIVGPKSADNPESVYNELMNACRYSTKLCKQGDIEKIANLEDLKNLKSSSDVVFSLFSSDTTLIENHYTNAMGIMFYNIGMVPLCDNVEATNQYEDVGEKKVDNIYALVNRGSVPTELNGQFDSTTSTSKSNTVSSTFTSGFKLSQKFSFQWVLKDPINFLWKYPTNSSSAGVEFSAEEFFQWDKTTSQTDTITKEYTDHGGFSRVVPANSISRVTKTEGTTTVRTDYDGPIAITYDVAMFSLSLDSSKTKKEVYYSDGNHFFATFSSAPATETIDKSENAVETLSEMTNVASGFNGYIKRKNKQVLNRESILEDWNNILGITVNNSKCEEIVKKLADNQPLSQFEGILHEKIDTITYFAEKDYSLSPIGKIVVSKSYDNNNNYTQLKSLDLEGVEETPFAYDKIEAYTLENFEFTGWSPTDGHWVLESPDGTETPLSTNASVADRNVSVRMDKSGKIYITPVKPGSTSVLKYVINEKTIQYYHDTVTASKEATKFLGNSLRYCTNEDIPENLKGKISLNIDKKLPSSRIGLEAKVDGEGEIQLDKYAIDPKSNENEVKINVTTKTASRIMSLVAQFHEDTRDPSKVTREEVISNSFGDSIDAECYYTIPQDTKSKVTFVAKTRSMYLNLDTKINEGDVKLSNYHPVLGEDVTITVNAPKNYGIKEIVAKYHDDEDRPNLTTRVEKISGVTFDNTCKLSHKFYGDATIEVVTAPLSELKSFDTDKYGNFIIRTYEDLCKMAELVNSGSGKDVYVNGSYIVANDIDCPGNTWSTPIGTTDNPFKGKFNGNGRAINNLVLLTSGLFGYADGAEIQNLKLNIASDNQIDSDYAGAICGVLNNGKISNCSVTGALGGAKTLGGIVGKADNSTIEKCMSDIHLWGNEDCHAIGGVCGEASNNTTVTDCAYVNRIYCGSSDAFVGGIVGISSGSHITNSYFYGDIDSSSEHDAYPIGGNLVENSENCYYYTDGSSCDSGNATAMAADQFKSGEVAYLLNGGRTGDNQAWYQNIDNGRTPDGYPVLVNNKENTVYKVDLANQSYSNYKKYFDVDEEGRFIIRNYDDLCKMANLVNSGKESFVNGSYIVANDIDCSGNTWSTPIGTIKNTFKGKFNGDGKAINNLHIATSGLFGYADDAEIQNLKLNLAGDNQTDSEYAGVICGVLNNGKISNCSVTGALGGAKTLGGIVGKADNSTIEKCMSDIHLWGNEDCHAIGGVCGEISNKTTVTDCAYVNRIYCGSSDAFVGGIVGIENGSHITNSYFYGDIDSSSEHDAYPIGGNLVENSENCYYYYTDGSSRTSGNATEKTADQFKSGEVAYLLNGGKTENQSWYQNLDNGLTPDDYPVLVNNDKNTVYKVDWNDKTYSNYKCFDVDENGNFIIRNYDDLCKMAELVNSGTDRFVNGSYIVENDIDCSGNTWKTSIGTTDNPFKGKFNGNGKAINNLHINGACGLFGYADGAEIQNLKLNLTDNSVANGTYAGAICGVLNNGKISNCSVTGKLGGAYKLGGIVGWADNSTIEKCMSDIHLWLGVFNTGAIAGVCAKASNKTTVTDCAYLGEISNTGGIIAHVGGIVGVCEDKINIKNSYFYGKINYKGHYVDAICGDANVYTENCYYIKDSVLSGAGTKMTADQFKSGEVAYLLNGGKTDDTQAWYQNIDNDLTPDDYPVLVNNKENTVYKVDLDEKTYSNYEHGKVDPQSHEQNGLRTYERVYKDGSTKDIDKAKSQIYDSKGEVDNVNKVITVNVNSESAVLGILKHQGINNQKGTFKLHDEKGEYPVTKETSEEILEKGKTEDPIYTDGNGCIFIKLPEDISTLPKLTLEYRADGSDEVIYYTLNIVIGNK